MRVHESTLDSMPQHSQTLCVAFYVKTYLFFPSVGCHTFTVKDTVTSKEFEVNRTYLRNWVCGCTAALGSTDACGHIERAYMYYRNMQELGESPVEIDTPTKHRRIKVR